MKKTIAIILTAAMLLSTAASLAEEETVQTGTDTVTAATVNHPENAQNGNMNGGLQTEDKQETGNTSSDGQTSFRNHKGPRNSGQQPPQMPGNQKNAGNGQKGRQERGMRVRGENNTQAAQQNKSQEQTQTETAQNKPQEQTQTETAQNEQIPAMPAGQQPPQMPDGQQPPQMPDGQQPPQMPDGQQPPQMPDGQQPPQMPDGQQPPEMPDGQQPPQMPGGMPGGADSYTGEYSTAVTLTEDSANAAYASTADNENAVLVSGNEVTISNASVSKSGSASGDNADFYGINATVLAKDGATLTVDGAEIVSDGAHANGIFSYGSGTTVNVSGTTIITSGNNSGGLMTTGGASLNAENVTVQTSGNSSAAIRSDRGGGTVAVEGGDYSTTGVGSPAIYSTADITVANAKLSASNSEAVVIEGGNSVTLNGVDITGSNKVLNGQSTLKTNVLIYQSMSGDAAEGSSSFTMTGGSMAAETGAMFHVTNVTTTINLENVSFDYAEDSSVFLNASADSWGNAGKNGGNVTLNLVNQEITGAILSDSVSSVAVHMDENSSWTLTGDSSVTEFSGDLSRVNLNGYTLYINGEAVKDSNG